MKRYNLLILVTSLLLVVAVLSLTAACRSTTTPTPTLTTRSPLTTPPTLSVTVPPTTTTPGGQTTTTTQTTQTTQTTTTAATQTTSPAPTLIPGKVLKVGMILPATGAAAEKGKPGGEAVLDAMDYVNNELGGAGGYKIEIEWRDSNYDSAKVGTIIREFMDGKLAMFTAMSSKEMTAAQEAANRAGFPGMVAFPAPNNYIPPQHIYAQTPDYGDDWVAFTRYYLQTVWKGAGRPKMALHLLNNTTGSGVKDAATAKAAALGVDIVAIEEHTATTISETDSLTRIKSKNPDVLFISSTPQPTSIILKNAKDLGMLGGSMTVGMAHASFTKALVDLAGADVTEGVYGVYPTVTWDDNLPGVAKAREYAQKNHPGSVGNMDYLYMWNHSLIVADILRTAVKNVGYDVIAKGDAAAWKAVEEAGIQKMNYDVQKMQGAVSYAAGNNSLSQYVKIYTVKGGKITPVGDWVSVR